MRVPDVTGYGLLGHASEMAAGNDVRLKIDSGAVPYFADAPALVAQDTYTQAYLANMTFLADKVTFHTDSDAMRHILMEAETSGGLLFSLPAENADAAIAELHATDCPRGGCYRRSGGNGYRAYRGILMVVGLLRSENAVFCEKLSVSEKE